MSGVTEQLEALSKLAIQKPPAAANSQQTYSKMENDAFMGKIVLEDKSRVVDY